jgi:hypothetical protein
MAKRKSSAPLLILGVGAAIVAAVAFSSRSASAAEAEPEAATDPQEAFDAAMRSDVTDPSVVQSYADWLNQQNRPDLAAVVNQKANALRAEAILREALNADVVATTADLQGWAEDLGTIPAYLSAVQTRAAAQQGMVPLPSRQTIELLSGTGTLVVDYAAFSPAPAVASAASPPVVVAPEPVKPKVKPKTPKTPATTRPENPILTAPAPTPAPSPAPVPVPSQPASPPPVVPAPTPVTPPVPPIAVEETKPQADPIGTIALARALISEEDSAGWKHVSDAVKTWQGKAGLTKDGKLGTGGILRMAQECAVLPLVRYWSLGGKTLAQQLANYRTSLFTMAEAKKLEGDTVWAAGLVASAEREQGQGWPQGPAPVALDFPGPAELETIESNLDAILNRGPNG